ncbi:MULTISPECIES: DUF3098 domain-containing protein [unclassified Mucilaginibacter]|uniref:DUF3098 domain-containing protein n=1 Tax=unclassified Mucilaginibacter TaxID=2617802 RepID=UPI000AF14BDF|nr:MULTISPECIES: DUF3098 domain-containing protein [unclassified Mucilaginibacter]PLW90423.1 MAG: DUF3098 domain-containing protein [Mucilaginibacter sp.]HEK20187.1 DUF3098 domain-containing protein [Bacteroidota bacterium]
MALRETKTTGKAATPAAKNTEAPVNTIPAQFVFSKDNYMWLIIAIAVVAFGFVLMSGTTDIYSTTKIVIAPIVVLTGFGIGFYAILKKPAAK